MVVVAPTGLAAVNVGGQTIHSFFGLPPRLVRKDDIRRSRNARIMRGLKLLVIDEVSMVRSDIMWAIDQSLRVNRGRAREPFGGVRLAMFGDLHQLPPVIDEGEVAAHLETEHGGPFFFDVGALREGHGTALIELSQVFRQKDEALIGVLNKVRDGDAGEDDLAVLNERVHPIRTLSEGEPYVILVPTNAAARRINAAYLEALTGRPETFQAGVTGEFSESAQPTDATLVLKPGAKVMLLRNDPDRRWVNGTIARISRLEPDKVWVEVDGVEHEVERVSWENRRYAFDKDAGDHRRDGGRHLQAVPAAARLGAHHPQEPGPDARQGLHRPGAGHLRPRPGLRGAVPLPHAGGPGAGAPAAPLRHPVRPGRDGLPPAVRAAGLIFDAPSSRKPRAGGARPSGTLRGGPQLSQGPGSASCSRTARIAHRIRGRYDR